MRIKNWDRFQHFKDRKPIWIKLYRDLLDDLNWHELDGKSAKALVMIWLIASEELGKLPEIKTLAFRLRMSEKETKEVVTKLSQWLEQDDINTISGVYQDDMPEKRREETDKDKEKEKETDTPSGVSQQVWDSFVKQRKTKKAQVTALVIDGIQKEADKAGWTLEMALNEVVVRNWQSFKAEWVAKPENKADQVFTTVPSRFSRDPALIEVENKLKQGVPMPPEIRAAMERLRK
jgi:hypothetical protein